MKFEQVVKEVIKLARAAHPKGTGKIYSGGDLRELVMRPRTPEVLALRSFLKGQSRKCLQELTAVMYVGRGDFRSVRDARQHVSTKVSSTHDGDCNYIAEKAPLAEYLSDGLE